MQFPEGKALELTETIMSKWDPSTIGLVSPGRRSLGLNSGQKAKKARAQRKKMKKHRKRGR